VLRGVVRERPEISSEAFDPVRFLVRLVTADFDRFREGDWLNLREDLKQFLELDILGLTFQPLDSMPVPDVSGPEGMMELRSTLASLIYPFAESQSSGVPAAAHSARLKEYAGFQSEYAIPADALFAIKSKQGERPTLKLSADHRALIFLKAAFVLLVANGPEASRVRLCPECGSLFIRVRKQLYCSRKCVNRVNMRRWLADLKGRESHRRSSRKTYERAVVRRTGPNVKVSRRGKR
jgi:hypothetical protein